MLNCKKQQLHFTVYSLTDTWKHRRLSVLSIHVMYLILMNNQLYNETKVIRNYQICFFQAMNSQSITNVRKFF